MTLTLVPANAFMAVSPANTKIQIQRKKETKWQMDKAKVISLPLLTDNKICCETQMPPYKMSSFLAKCHRDRQMDTGKTICHRSIDTGA